MKEAHRHDFNQIKIMRITKITNPNYTGDAGDKAILTRVCECKANKAFEYGSFKEMRELGLALSRANREAEHGGEYQ